MRAELKSLSFDPDPETLPPEPAAFAFDLRMLVGPAGGSGEESYDLTVCSPEWLAAECRRAGGIYEPRHHLVVDVEGFDADILANWLAARVRRVAANSWPELAVRVARIGYWEFEDDSFYSHEPDDVDDTEQFDEPEQLGQA